MYCMCVLYDAQRSSHVMEVQKMQDEQEVCEKQEACMANLEKRLKEFKKLNGGLKKDTEKLRKRMYEM